MLTTSKRTYFRSTISYKDCPKKLWNTLNTLLGRNAPKCLPSALSPSVLATSFLNFFNDKIVNLCANTPSTFDKKFGKFGDILSMPPPQL